MICVICHFPVELDDAVAPTGKGRCVCLRCFIREVGDDRKLPPDLLREVRWIVATAANP